MEKTILSGGRTWGIHHWASRDTLQLKHSSQQESCFQNTNTRWFFLKRIVIWYKVKKDDQNSPQAPTRDRTPDHHPPTQTSKYTRPRSLPTCPYAPDMQRMFHTLEIPRAIQHATAQQQRPLPHHLTFRHSSFTRLGMCVAARITRRQPLTSGDDLPADTGRSIIQ